NGGGGGSSESVGDGPRGRLSREPETLDYTAATTSRPGSSATGRSTRRGPRCRSATPPPPGSPSTVRNSGGGRPPDRRPRRGGDRSRDRVSCNQRAAW